MNYRTLFYNEPEKLAAMVVFIISASLLVGQLLSVLFFSASPIEARLPLLDKKQLPIKIDHKAALFQVALFGEYVPKISDINIRQSDFDAKIAGIMYSKSNQASSQVLIRVAGGTEQLYTQGDELPGGAVIKQINKDNIIVFYQGALESLSLPQNELLFDAPAKPLTGE